MRLIKQIKDDLILELGKLKFYHIFYEIIADRNIFSIQNSPNTRGHLIDLIKATENNLTGMI